MLFTQKGSPFGRTQEKVKKPFKQNRRSGERGKQNDRGRRLLRRSPSPDSLYKISFKWCVQAAIRSPYEILRNRGHTQRQNRGNRRTLRHHRKNNKINISKNNLCLHRLFFSKRLFFKGSHLKTLNS